MLASALTNRILSDVRAAKIAVSRDCRSASLMNRIPVYLPSAPFTSMKNLPSLSMPSRISPSCSSFLIGLSARGIDAWNPAVIAGVTIMKMISNTNITSIIGVTLMSAATATLPVDRATGLRRFLRLEFLREDRPPELRADALDQIVDQLFRDVGHLDIDEIDLGEEVVVQPHRGNRHEQADTGRDQRLGDPAGDRRQPAGAAGRRHALERVHDPEHRAEQSHERRRGARRSENAQAALRSEERRVGKE